jgi:Dyp-type peroxidase family
VTRDIDHSDVQGNLMHGYGFLNAAYLFFRATDQEPALAALREIGTRVRAASSHAPPAGDVAVNLAFSHAGLKRLGVTPPMLASFPPAFREGMARRAERLGDLGASAPRHWVAPGTDSGARQYGVDVLVVVQGDTADLVQQASATVVARAQGLELIHREVGAALTPDGSPPSGRTRRDTIEHFGFVDGISQPSIDGRGGGEAPLQPGEFLLGHPDEAGDVADEPRPAALARNGSYLVYRKLEQDVAGFRSFARAAMPDRPGYVAAKLVGRWPSGAPLALHPESDPRDRGVPVDPADQNAFGYSSDPDGRACPIGSHIRRANPRDDDRFGPNLAHRHALIRRGIPYGPRLADDRTAPDGEERGLLFVAYCADIVRQFEFLQRQWLNDGDAFGLGRDPDPVSGNHNGTAGFRIPGDDPRFLDLPSFVTTRAGGYFFQPGIRALGLLVSGAFNQPWGADA